MLTINLESTSDIPMYEQIYRHIKNEIKCGNLPYHTKLPSTRSLAGHLQVSRNTVDMAYAQLVSEGYIETVPKSGYYVSTISNLARIDVNPTLSVRSKIKEVSSYRYDFSPFAIDINSFPYNIWRKLSKNCMNDYNNNLFLLGNNQGDEDLRNAIARYLHESRSVNCSAEQIIVGAGADYLLQLLAQILSFMNRTNNLLSASSSSCFTAGKIAMENPSYKQAYRIFTGLHYEITPIPLDSNGISIGPLYQTDANVVYATPSHQYPLGIVMPIKRRMELLEWANGGSNRYIIEDDHDSEFRYKGKPIPSLQGIDSSGKVIYIGTFSRAVAPAIRIGYMVLPESLLQIYREHFYYYTSTVSRVDQSIMKSFIEEGYFERHLNKMRKIYKNKHDLLIHCLKIFKDSILIEGENAGLHLVVRFKSSALEQELIAAAAKEGIKLYGLKEHYLTSVSNNAGLNPTDYPTILLGYANVQEQDIKSGVELLYQLLSGK
ncbi:MAG: transcriptional regulator, GntR family with aminotransferase domain [Lachnospiraceae bacterium]|jgi:GntR family transcriptional regulator/MocR family aminotransferase|nr:transcriptional regulator, GntR family with aminotransferase domain [Lachnospiraceae bacterium]